MYAGADGDQEPEPGERQQFWVSGYTRKDGKQVEGKCQNSVLDWTIHALSA